MPHKAKSRLFALLFGITLVILIGLLLRKVAQLSAENRRLRGVNSLLEEVARERGNRRREPGPLHRFADTLED